MRGYIGPGDAIRQVQHGVQDQIYAAVQGDPHHSGAQQCHAQRALEEWAQVRSITGAEGHEGAGQGDPPVLDLQALPEGVADDGGAGD